MANLNFPKPDLDPVLTQEAQNIVASAYGSMTSWIDENVENLKARSKGELDDAMKELNTAFAEIKTQDEARRVGLQRILDDIQSTANEAVLSNHPDLKKDIVALTKIVNTELDEREKRLKAVGEKTVDVMMNLGKKFIGL